MNIGGEKTALRLEMQALRRLHAASAAEYRSLTLSICAFLAEEACKRRARLLGVYLAARDEIDLAAFIAETKRRLPMCRFAAPRWNSITYEMALLETDCDGKPARGSLRTGPMGILESADAAAVEPREIDFWVVPGLAFTRAGARLGYGGGWFDRLLAGASPDAYTAAVAMPFQILDAIPCEMHDIRVDDVFTPDGRIARK